MYIHTRITHRLGWMTNYTLYFIILVPTWSTLNNYYYKGTQWNTHTHTYLLLAFTFTIILYNPSLIIPNISPDLLISLNTKLGNLPTIPLSFYNNNLTPRAIKDTHVHMYCLYLILRPFTIYITHHASWTQTEIECVWDRSI